MFTGPERREFWQVWFWTEKSRVLFPSMGVLGTTHSEQGKRWQNVDMIHNSPICPEDFVTHGVSLGEPKLGLFQWRRQKFFFRYAGIFSGKIPQVTRRKVVEEKFLSRPLCSRTIHPFRECKDRMNYVASFKYVATLFLKCLILSLHAQQKLPRCTECTEGVGRTAFKSWKSITSADDIFSISKIYFTTSIGFTAD